MNKTNYSLINLLHVGSTRASQFQSQQQQAPPIFPPGASQFHSQQTPPVFSQSSRFGSNSAGCFQRSPLSNPFQQIPATSLCSNPPRLSLAGTSSTLQIRPALILVHLDVCSDPHG